MREGKVKDRIVRVDGRIGVRKGVRRGRHDGGHLDVGRARVEPRLYDPACAENFEKTYPSEVASSQRLSRSKGDVDVDAPLFSKGRPLDDPFRGNDAEGTSALVDHGPKPGPFRKPSRRRSFGFLLSISSSMYVSSRRDLRLKRLEAKRRRDYTRFVCNPR